MQPLRSLLFVPANEEDWVKSTPRNGNADGYIFDLEDAVPADEKPDARDILSRTLETFGDVESYLAVRVNPTDSGFFEEDLEKIVHPNLDGIILPKLSVPEQVKYADNILSYLETTNGIDNDIEILALPETARGFYLAYDLINSSERVVTTFGLSTKSGDIARALGYQWTEEGKETLFLRSKILMEARAAGLNQIFSGLWSEIENIQGLREDAELARQLGYTGYVVIHPNHVEPVNEIFTPNQEEVERFQQMIDRLEAAAEEGKAAIRFQDELIDIANIQTAKKKLDRAEAFGISVE